MIARRLDSTLAIMALNTYTPTHTHLGVVAHARATREPPTLCRHKHRRQPTNKAATRSGAHWPPQNNDIKRETIACCQRPRKPHNPATPLQHAASKSKSRKCSVSPTEQHKFELHTSDASIRMARCAQKTEVYGPPCNDTRGC